MRWLKIQEKYIRYFDIKQCMMGTFWYQTMFEGVNWNVRELEETFVISNKWGG